MLTTFFLTAIAAITGNNCGYLALSSFFSTAFQAPNRPNRTSQMTWSRIPACPWDELKPPVSWSCCWGFWFCSSLYWGRSGNDTLSFAWGSHTRRWLKKYNDEAHLYMKSSLSICHPPLTCLCHTFMSRFFTNRKK